MRCSGRDQAKPGTAGVAGACTAASHDRPHRRGTRHGAIACRRDDARWDCAERSVSAERADTALDLILCVVTCGRVDEHERRCCDALQHR